MKKTIGFCTIFLIIFTAFLNNYTQVSKAKNISDSGDGGEILICVEDCGENLVLYTYISYNTTNEKSVNAGSVTKTYRYMLADVEVLVIKYTVSYSYGHSDGIARISSSSYQITKLLSGWGVSVSNFTKSHVNGEPAIATLSFTLTRDGSPSNKSIVIHCKNNGNAY